MQIKVEAQTEKFDRAGRLAKVVWRCPHCNGEGGRKSCRMRYFYRTQGEQSPRVDIQVYTCIVTGKKYSPSIHWDESKAVNCIWMGWDDFGHAGMM